MLAERRLFFNARLLLTARDQIGKVVGSPIRTPGCTLTRELDGMLNITSCPTAHRRQNGTIVSDPVRAALGQILRSPLDSLRPICVLLHPTRDAVSCAGVDPVNRFSFGICAIQGVMRHFRIVRMNRAPWRGHRPIARGFPMRPCRDPLNISSVRPYAQGSQQYSSKLGGVGYSARILVALVPVPSSIVPSPAVQA